MAAVAGSRRAARPRAHPRRLSRARAPHQRPSARLPRQRRLVAAARRRHRRGRRLRARRTTPTCTAACTRCRRRRRRCTRARARRRGASSTPPRPRKSSSCAARPRRSTSSRSPTAGRASAPGDEIVVTRLEHHSNIVPWQLLCAQTGAVLRVVPIDRRGVVDFDAYLAHARPAHAHRRPRPRLECARHGAAARRFHRRGARARDRDRRRRRPGRAAPAGRRAGARLRLLRVLRAQDVRPDRHRRAVRARSPARRHAALAGRRRHDPLGLLRGLDLEPPAAPLRGRHAEHRRRGRASAPRSTTSAASARRASPRTSRTCSTTRPRRLAAIDGLTLVGTAPGQEQPRLLHGRGHPPARPRHGARLARRRRAHRPPLRDAGDGVLRRAGDDARLVRALQHARRRSTRCTTPCCDAIRMLR